MLIPIQHVDLAKLFESLVAQDDRFELCYPRALSLVCFRLKNSSSKDNSELEEMINKSGKAYLSHTGSSLPPLLLAPPNEV